MPITRTFSSSELDEAMYNNQLLDEILEESEGTTLHRSIFRSDGQAWEVRYRHHDGFGIFWNDDEQADEEFTATAVEEREVTAFKWLPLEAEATQ